MTGCEICVFTNSRDFLITETDHWRVVLASEQSYLGRSFVTLKDHKESLSDLTKDEWLDFNALVKQVESLLEITFGAGKPFNWACMMNDAFKAEEPQPHVHWHVRPRYAKPVTIGGKTYTDPDYGHHYNRDRKYFASAAELQDILSHIKKHI